MATDVKVYHSSMIGAPTLSGQAGTLIAVLDACLINGFGLGTVDSVVVAGGIATVTRASGHPFDVDAIALMSGATPAGLNGEKRVLSTTGTTYTFDATGISDQTATGTITHKVAPAGWTKQYNSTNLAAYKSGDVAATGCLLRVDDTGTTNARAVAYKTMSDIDTGVDPFPSAAQVSGGAFLGKSYSADSTTRPWIIVADSRAFYLMHNWSSAVSYQMSYFGDFLSNKSGDAYACSFNASSVSITSYVPGATGASELSYSHTTAEQSMWASRSVTGLTASKPMLRSAIAPMGTNTAVFSGQAGVGFAAYPNPADNGLYLTQMTLGESAPYCYRGVLPGYRFCPQGVGGSIFANREKVTGIAGMSGRTLMAVNSQFGVSFFDITGPWR